MDHALELDLRTLEVDGDSHLQLAALYLFCHYSKVYIHTDAINKHLHVYAQVQKIFPDGGGGEVREIFMFAEGGGVFQGIFSIIFRTKF